MNEPLLTVVINTYNKGATLEKVLDALRGQVEVAPADFDVVVRDDGSTDDTPHRLAEQAARWGARLAWSRGTNAGVSAARNAGVAQARGRLVLILGDDIVASPTLVREHLRAHEIGMGPVAAVVGRVAWPPDLDEDPFLHWLDNGGPQFAYTRLGERTEIGPSHFYACNVSLPRATLVAHPFDPAITYGFEDTELGHRLRQAGVPLRYQASALGFHHHPRSFGEFRARQFKVGQSLYAALRNHPDLRATVSPPRFPVKRRVRLALRRLAYPMARLAAHRSPAARRLQQSYWRTSLDLAMYRGYRDALRRDPSPPPHVGP